MFRLDETPEDRGSPPPSPWGGSPAPKPRNPPRTLPKNRTPPQHPQTSPQKPQNPPGGGGGEARPRLLSERGGAGPAPGRPPRPPPPPRGRSRSAPPVLWAAQRYGRRLRRMSDEFQLQVLPRPRSLGGAPPGGGGWRETLRAWWGGGLPAAPPRPPRGPALSPPTTANPFGAGGAIKCGGL
uniref:Uncharacterized protein n=1 Tax=Geospiza parvula TaxID=87175 RepID=A0A8C3MKH7_GEOPR